MQGSMVADRLPATIASSRLLSLAGSLKQQATAPIAQRRGSAVLDRTWLCIAFPLARIWFCCLRQLSIRYSKLTRAGPAGNLRKTKSCAK